MELVPGWGRLLTPKNYLTATDPLPIRLARQILQG
jgi:hypothetical protein